ncbi:SMI1/KNR4 family protein [Priestia megaterium]|uniref:SMI1/KNR4 family protein n=1 Tax=Priestia megaterium TaxID=1404 RepID=A0ABD4WWK7_PRIMG|nr:SMI1/KNR4 family protein [Priestia megaterium]MDD9784647.1 SMI1/KNR4 family protein [Priestia megaterium]QLC90854.1 SMI1/KNR4 family protein [Priestia megaterium]
MYEFLEEEIKKIYQDDNKKLRTQTVLYGEIEGSWHTHLHPGLTQEEIEKFELRVGRNFPVTYKEFLSSYNGCYLFDLLRMGGRELDSYKGLTIEEQVRSTVDVQDIQEIHLRKRTPKEHFIFADSLVKNAYYVMDKDEKVLEVDFRTKKVIENYDTLKDFIVQIIQEGKDNIANEIYFEFR